MQCFVGPSLVLMHAVDVLGAKDKALHLKYVTTNVTAKPVWAYCIELLYLLAINFGYILTV